MPPVADKLAEYILFSSPAASDEFPICSVASDAFTVMLKFADAVWTGELESLACAVNEKVPG